MHAGEDVRVPDIARHAWHVFWKLERRGRAGNGFAAMPISNMELQAWLTLHEERLTRWELDVLDVLEDERRLFLNRDNEKASKNKKNKSEKMDRVVKTPMTIEMFDAMF